MSAAPKAGPGWRPPPLRGAELALGTFVLSLAMFMNVLDTSIANVSIPAISGDLGVSTSQGTWVITSFAVSNAISLPLTGWLTQRIGQVRLFVASVLLFTIASWLCGMAPSLEMLIAFRVVQGAVAGPMIPLSQTLLLTTYPPHKAGIAIASWSMTTLIAPVVGPLLGGWVTDNLSWPWIFFINVPVGLVAGLTTWLLYRERETPTRKIPVDTVGLVLLVIWVGALQIMLDKGKELDWFGSTTIIALCVTTVVGLAFFLVWELTEEHPVVDLTLFARRNFWSGVTALALAYGLFFGSVVILPLWLQQTMGYTATMAGWAIAPVGALAMLFTPVAGRMVDRTDKRAMATFSFSVFVVVMWLRSEFTPQVDLFTIMIPTILQGLGVAFFFIPLISLVLSGLPPERLPAASGLANFMRMSAGAFGTSIATTMWENRAAMHHANLSEAVTRASDATAQSLAGLRSLGLTAEQSLAVINRAIDQQAFTMSADDIFRGAAIVFVLLAGYIWIARHEPAGSTASAAPMDAGH